MAQRMIETVAEIIKFIEQLAEHEKLRDPVQKSLKGGAIVGACTAAGGLLGGHTGLVVGGAIGTSIGAVAAGSFKSVASIIRYEMSREQLNALVNSFWDFLKKAVTPWVSSILKYILENVDILSSVISLIRNVVQNLEYKMIV